LSTIDRDTIDALNELGVRYARHVDRREFDRLGEIFPADGSIAVFPGDPATHAPLYGMNSLAEIQGAFELLKRYQNTFHFIGQQLTFEADANSARGETYCIASHFHQKNNQDHNFVMYIRYQDRFAKIDGRWKIQSRQLIVDRTTGEDVDA
jgi:3-phenylpropionate/cinnamic acid dioxygenase small subunit